MDPRFREIQPQDRRFSLQQVIGRVSLPDEQAPALQGILYRPER